MLGNPREQFSGQCVHPAEGLPPQELNVDFLVVWAQYGVHVDSALSLPSGTEVDLGHFYFGELESFPGIKT